MSAVPSAVSRLVIDAAKGTLVGADELVAAFYPELKRLAARRMRSESPDHTWQPTALVHELFLELTTVRELRPVHPLNARERAAFFALASLLMTRLLIHHTRPLKARAEQTPILDSLLDNKPPADQLAAVEVLLERLSRINLELRSVVELKVFGGFINEDIAEELGCSVRTVQRHWQFARAWLGTQIFGPGCQEPANVSFPKTADAQI